MTSSDYCRGCTKEIDIADGDCQGSLKDKEFIIELERHNEKCGRKGFDMAGLHLNLG